MKKNYSEKQVTNFGTVCGIPRKEPVWKKNRILRRYKKQNPQRRIDLQIENVNVNAMSSFFISDDSPSSCSKEKEYVFLFIFNDDINCGNVTGKNKSDMCPNSGLDGLDILDLTSILKDKQKTFGELKLKNVSLSKSVIESIASKVMNELFAKNKAKTTNLADIEAEYFLVTNTATPDVMENKSTPEPYLKKLNVLHFQDPGCDSSGIDLPISPAESTPLTEDVPTLFSEDAINKENLIDEHQQSTVIVEDISPELPKVSICGDQQLEKRERVLANNIQKGHTKKNSNNATDVQLSPVLLNSPFSTNGEQIDMKKCHKTSQDNILLIVNDTEQSVDQECSKASENSVSTLPENTRKYKKLSLNTEDKEKNTSSHTGSSLHDVKKTDEPDSKFVCIKCNQIYKSRESLRKHVKKRCKGIAKCYSCSRCDSQFKKRVALSTHIKTVCKSRPRVKESLRICEYCGKQFNDRSSLWQHLESHRNLKRHKCPECGKGFNSSSYLNVHVKYVHKKEKTWFYCSCGIRSLSKKHIMAHEQTHNIPEGSEILMPFECNYCGKKFISQHMLTIHQNMNHKAKKCSVCGEIFGSLYQLKKHKINVHGMKRPAAVKKKKKKYDKDKDISCPICDKTLSSIPSLNSHLEAIHSFRNPRSGEKVECGKCSKAFLSYGSYICHTRFHHKEKVTETEMQSLAKRLLVGDKSEMLSEAHACNHCDKKFSTAVKLKNHLNIHKLPNASLVCSVCDLRFETKAKFYSHKYSAHVSEEERTCQICMKIFPDKKRFYNHKVMHATTSYLCSECGSKYKRSGDYRRHMRDKHGLNST